MRSLFNIAECLGGTLLLDDIDKRIFLIIQGIVWMEFPYPKKKK